MYVLVFIVLHVDIELEDNKQFISNIPRIVLSASKNISFLSVKDWILSAFLLSQESCMSLSLVCTVLHWMHKKCSGLKRLTKDPDYRCTRCQGTAHPLDGRPQREVQHDKLKVVAPFCYLGDMLSAAGGCELSTTKRVKTAWKKFKELLPVLSSCHLSFKTRGRVYSCCVWSAMLHASETWPLTKPNLQRLQWNDSAMIRQICNVRPQDIVTTRFNAVIYLEFGSVESQGLA